MHSIFLKIPMIVYNANVNGNAHVSGIPSMTSIDGVVHNIERKLRQFDEDFYVEKWSYIVEKMEYRSGTKRFIPCRTKEKGSVNAAMDDEKLAHIEQTIIIEVNSSQSISEWKNKRDEGILNHIFAGIVFNGGTTRIRTSNGNVRLSFRSSLLETLKSLPPSALLIEDKTHLITILKKEGENNLSAIIRILNTELDDYQGYLIPVAIGYYAISSLEERKDQRMKGRKHIYAEPVIGMARARTVASSILNIDSDDFKPSWYNAKFDENQNISEKYYIIQGK